MIFFTNEDKSMLLNNFKSLYKDFYDEFGDFDDRIQEEIKFWDGFFQKEKESKTLVFGDDEKQTEKRVNLSTAVSNLEMLEGKYGLDEFEFKNEKYSSRYLQDVLENPNYVHLDISIFFAS